MRRLTEAITRARVRLVRLPIKDAPADAIQRFNALELVLVTIADTDGREGIGFGYTIGTGGASILELLRSELLPRILGRDCRRITAIHDSLTAAIHALMPGCVSSNALAAIDIALWDLGAKRAQLPLHVVLGGAREAVPAYNTDVGWLSREQKELVALAGKAVKRDGFRAIKLKVGKPDPQEDFDRVAAVREAVGPHVGIMVDANQAWTLDEAIRRFKLLEAYDLIWIEEPLEATNVSAHAELARRVSIPIAGGESLYHPDYFYEYLCQDALHICQPDICRVGGITAALKVCHLAEAAGVRIAPHVNPELSIALAAAVTNSAYVEYVPQMEPLLMRRLEVRAGMAQPFAIPGHGIEFAEAALQQFTVLSDVEAAA